MLAVVVICLMLASGQGISLEKLTGQHDYCTWGAQYWCSSVATAAACDKKDWCTTNYWAYDARQDAPCSVLQQLVTNIRTLARESTQSFLTQNEIAVFIVKGCALLQDEESRNQCKQLITDEDILFKLLNLVGSDLSAQSVATAVGVCKRNIPAEQGSDVACAGLPGCSSSLQHVIHGGTEEQREKLWPACFICKFVMQQLASILAKNATEKQIEAALQTVCKVLPSFIRQQCSALVSKYAQRLIQLLLRYPPEKVCGVFGLCSDDVLASNKEIQQSPALKDTKCFLCKLVINKVKSMLSDHTTQDEIKAALEKVCNQLPPVLQSVCNNVIETYEPQLIQMLLSSFTAEQICEKLNMCTDLQAFANEIQQSHQIKDTKCFLCKLVINKVKSMLSDHTTQDEIKAALEKVCNQLPPVLQSVCNNVIETYEPQLIQMLLSSFTAEQICEKLKMCTDVQASANEIQQSPDIKDTKCFLCKLVINKVKSMLSDHTTQDEIKAALEKVCNQLPPVLQSVCNNVIETYEPQLIQMLLSSFTAEQICEKLNMCTDVQASANEIQQSSDIKDTKCFLCKLVINKVKSMLSDHTTQDEIKAALEKVCHQLPPVLQSVCNNVIETYEPQLIQMLLSSFTAEQICEKLNMCTDLQVSVDEIQQSPNIKDTKCFLCKLIINQVKSILSNHTTQDEIKAALEKVCNVVPPILTSACKKAIETYEPLLIQMFLSSFTTEQICSKLRMCKAARDKSQLLFVPEKNAQSATLPDKEHCSACLLTLYNVQSTLSNPKWQSESRAVLHELCSDLQDDQGLCQMFVDASFSVIVSYSQTVLFPVELCQKADFCKPTEFAVDDGSASDLGQISAIFK